MLFVGRIGLGLSGPPAITVAHATVVTAELPDATSQANTTRRVGGALGGALFVVILENHGGSTDAAFHAALWRLAGATAVARVLAGLPSNNAIQGCHTIDMRR